eukprot:6762459-Alexandrium_andersonii.AAC.1
MVTEVLRNEPSIFVEWGATLSKLTRSVLAAFEGTAKGSDEHGHPVASGGAAVRADPSEVQVREEGRREAFLREPPPTEGFHAWRLCQGGSPPRESGLRHPAVRRCVGMQRPH